MHRSWRTNQRIDIFTFALFEKKRDEMLRVGEGLKEWQR
jgi:hypothetical protein